MLLSELTQIERREQETKSQLERSSKRVSSSSKKTQRVKKWLRHFRINLEERNARIARKFAAAQEALAN